MMGVLRGFFFGGGGVGGVAAAISLSCFWAAFARRPAVVRGLGLDFGLGVGFGGIVARRVVDMVDVGVAEDMVRHCTKEGRVL